MASAKSFSLGLGILVGIGAILSVETTAQEGPEIGVKKGQMYPDFLLPTVDGDLGRFSDYRGKKILLFHFASW